MFLYFGGMKIKNNYILQGPKKNSLILIRTKNSSLRFEETITKLEILGDKPKLAYFIWKKIYLSLFSLNFPIHYCVIDYHV